RCRRRLKRGSKHFSLFWEFFPSRFEHLIVRGFLETIDNAMLANRLLFLSTGTRHAVTFRAGDHSPLFRQICVIGGLLGGRMVFFAHQLPAGLLPTTF